MTYDDWRGVLSGERLPTVVVDLDAFDRNVALVADILRSSGHGHHLRVATKSLRVPELIRRVMDFGAPYQGLMCFTAEEAAYLASQGFDDFLIAYPTLLGSDLEVIGQLHSQGKTIRLVVDSIAHLHALSEAGRGRERPLEAVLDVDMSLRPLGKLAHLGVRRSPLRSVADVLALYGEARRLAGVRIAGLMGYEAQVAGLGDRNPFRRLLNPVARQVRRRSVRAIARLRQELSEALTEQGWKPELFNGGGTGSVTFTVQEPWLTELSVGSGFLCSHLFDYFSNVRYEPACFFVLQAARASDPGFVTCLGGGYIASGEPGWDKVPVPYLPEGLRLVPTEGCGEVQTPLRLPRGVRIEPGAPVLFRHAKAGELAEHFGHYLLVAGGKLVGRVPTYRGLGQAFL